MKKKPLSKKQERRTHNSCWNYRIIRKKVDGYICFGVFEVYYEGEKIKGWTTEPMSGWYETAKDAYGSHTMMLDAWKKKLLIEDENEKIKEGKLPAIMYNEDRKLHP